MSSYACHTLPRRNYVEWLESVFWQYFYVDMTNIFYRFLLWFFLKRSGGCTDCAWVLIHPGWSAEQRARLCTEHFRSTFLQPRKACCAEIEGAFMASGAWGAVLACFLFRLLSAKVGTVSWLRNPFDILAMTHRVTSCPQSSQCHRVVFLACLT